MPSTVTDRLFGTTTSVAVKSPCRVATTANITLSGLQTIDGVTVASGNRVLVMAQTTTSQNGIYVASSGDWTRATDFNGSLDVVAGTIVNVRSGTTYAMTFWQVAADATIGTDAITFTQFVVGDSDTVNFTQAGTGAEERTVQSKLRDFCSVLDFIPVAQHTAILAGTSTYDASGDIQQALNNLDVEADGIGGELYFPIGVVGISVPIEKRNWVALKGFGRGSQIHALAGFSGTKMVLIENNTSSPADASMFSVQMERLFLDAKGRVANCIHAYAWQDNGGLSRVAMQGFTTNGVLIERGDGGASWCKLENVEIFGTDASAQYGIRVNQVSAVGAFMLHLSGVSITGESGNQLPAAIYCLKDSLNIRSAHFEHAVYGVLIEGVGNHVLDGLTGGPGLDTLVGIDAAFTGTIAGHGLNPNTATVNTILNNVTSEHIVVGEGAITEYTYPNYTFEASPAAQAANVTGNNTNYTIVFGTERHDIGAWYAAGTGIATAPKSGRYQFDVTVALTIPNGCTTLVISLVTTGKTYELYRGKPENDRAASDLWTRNFSVVAKMARTDTAFVRVTGNGIGADTIDVETGSTFAGAYLYR